MTATRLPAAASKMAKLAIKPERPAPARKEWTAKNFARAAMLVLVLECHMPRLPMVEHFWLKSKPALRWTFFLVKACYICQSVERCPSWSA